MRKQIANIRSYPSHGLTILAIGSALGMGLGCGSQEQPEEEQWRPVGTPTASVAIVDTLSTPPGFLLADPIGVYRDGRGRYVAVDRSDKDLKVFDRDGQLAMTVSQPGEGPGEFEVLWGGGVTRGDSLYGYDFSDMTLQLYAPDGSYARTHPIGEGRFVPSDVTSLDETSLLVTHFPLGVHNEDLLQVIGIDGTSGPRFMNLEEYFTPDSPPLVQYSILHASGRNGLIVAGMVGYDTIMVFDDEGNKMGATRLPERVVPTTYKEAFQANNGSPQYDDGTFATDAVPVVSKIVTLSDRSALVQVASTVGGDPFVDLTAGGWFLALLVDRATNALWVEPVGYWDWGLLGGVNNGGKALVGRYVGKDYESIEIGLMSIEVKEGGQDD